MPRYLVLFKGDATPADLGGVLTTIGSAGSRVLQVWGKSSLYFDGPATTRNAVAARPGVVAVSDIAFPALPPLGLDVLASEVAAAWNFGFLPTFLSPPPPTDPVPSFIVDSGCGGGGAMSSEGTGTTASTIVGAASTFGLTPTLVRADRRALVGTVGVVVLFIDGPAGGAARFGPDDSYWMLKSLSAAFDGLYNSSPAAAHLLFTPAIHHVSISVNPATVPTPANPAAPTALEYEAAEAAWRDPALAALGAGAGRNGLRTLVNRSTFTFPPDWAFVVLFTKYRAAWLAYAPDYRDVVVSFDMVKAQYGLGELPFILAHEIGHTVGAKDETASSHCSIAERCGFSNAPNANCEITPLGPNPLSVPCLMKGRSFAVCLSTLSHLGWGDQDGDGVLDPYDPDFVPFP
jgi:hypothetical protein